jgi:hypothetical protein
MATAIPGTEFQNWQNLPSLTETLAGGKSPLLNILGLLMSPSEKEESKAVAPMGSGVGVTDVAGGIGIKPPGVSNQSLGATGEPSLKPKSPIFNGISPYSVQPNFALPKIGEQSPAQILNNSSQINSFWGVQS